MARDQWDDRIRGRLAKTYWGNRYLKHELLRQERRKGEKKSERYFKFETETINSRWGLDGKESTTRQKNSFSSSLKTPKEIDKAERGDRGVGWGWGKVNQRSSELSISLLCTPQPPPLSSQPNQARSLVNSFRPPISYWLQPIKQPRVNFLSTS